MSGERLPGWIVPWPAATSPKVLPSLIPLPDLRGLGEGEGGGRGAISLSASTQRVPLLLQLDPLAPGTPGHTAGPESITSEFNPEVELLVLAVPIMRRFYVEFMLNPPTTTTSTPASWTV